MGKAASVTVHDSKESQRLDMAFLLSLVEDPLSMAADLTAKDRKRLRLRGEMRDADSPAWRALDADASSRGRAALELLVR